MKAKVLYTFCLMNVFILLSSTNAYSSMNEKNNEWQFSLAPLFLWGMNIDGSSQIGPVNAPLQLDFTDDILSNLSAVFTLHFEAVKNDISLFAEYQYVQLEPTTRIPNGPEVGIDFTIQAAELGASYSVATWGNTDVEPIIGARWAYQDLETQVTNGPILVDSSENWWDGFVGVRFWTHFTDVLTLISRGDIGAGGSDFVWNLSFMLDYKFKNWGSVFAGYRWLDYDYDSGSGVNRYAYDALQQGPLAGIVFHW